MSFDSTEGDDVMTAQNPHWGTSLDMVLADEGLREAAKAAAAARVVAWQRSQEKQHAARNRDTIGRTSGGEPR